MTKTQLSNIQFEAYQKMVERSRKIKKSVKVTDKMVTKTLQDLLKEIK